MSQTFFRLTHHDWVQCFTKLSRAELGVLFYLRTLNPFGDRKLQINCQAIGEILDIHRTSVSRALKKLEKESFIELEITAAQVKLRSKDRDEKKDTENNANPPVDNDSGDSVHPRTGCASTHDDVHPRTKCASTHGECASTHDDVHPRTIRVPEPLPEKVSRSPQTLQTYSDFKKTLSENERENFLEFVREQIHNLERPINDLEAWLASKNAAEQNRWEIYYKNYQAQKFEQKPRNTQKTSRSGNSTREKNSAIAEFRKRMSLNRSANEPEPETPSEEFNSNESELENELEDSNSAESTQRNPEFDELIANPPQQTTKSLAELEREEAIAARRKQWEWKRKIKEAAEARAKQVNPDPEQRKAEMLRQVEAYKQFLQQQNEDTPPESNSKTRDARSETDLDENKEITGENDENK